MYLSSIGDRDYSRISDFEVTFPADVDEITVNVSVTPDEIYEDTEVFTAVLTLPDNAEGVMLGVDNAGLATITDDDGTILHCVHAISSI